MHFLHLTRRRRSEFVHSRSQYVSRNGCGHWATAATTRRTLDGGSESLAGAQVLREVNSPRNGFATRPLGRHSIDRPKIVASTLRRRTHSQIREVGAATNATFSGRPRPKRLRS